jgi:hypothetical protein
VRFQAQRLCRRKAHGIEEVDEFPIVPINQGMKAFHACFSGVALVFIEQEMSNTVLLSR